ncbi:hypothetical protein [Stenomitos frigidus]|uniref:Uncharacterized protein n=1 Tax=Stenomitos frigidus ULC18 TaxID=2107698 RepID=A0A2T1DUA1_9CYAN|nr:hypothetical protein [Stenomitos frigidus]PSB24078.1 hypothetical protein C7B82_28460 [Stenomitos frigidus ULC18]
MAAKQRHGATEDERTPDRERVIGAGKDINDPEQNAESQSLRLGHGDEEWCGAGQATGVSAGAPEGMTLDGAAAEQGRGGRRASYYSSNNWTLSLEARQPVRCQATQQT